MAPKTRRRRRTFSNISTNSLLGSSSSQHNTSSQQYSPTNSMHGDGDDDMSDSELFGGSYSTRDNQSRPSKFMSRWLRRGSVSAGGDAANQSLLPDVEHGLQISGIEVPGGSSRMRRLSVGGPRSFSGRSRDDIYEMAGVPLDPFDSDASDAPSILSKPETRRSSLDESIADVCMPMESPREEVSVRKARRAWPDTAPLEDFAEKEKAELAELEAADMVSRGLADRYAVNEAEQAGPLRPPRFVPWAKYGKRSSGIQRLARGNSVPFEHLKSRYTYQDCRFTYFRDDLPATIHSPNISGLLRPEQTYADLFRPPPEPTNASNSNLGGHESDHTSLNSTSTPLAPNSTSGAPSSHATHATPVGSTAPGVTPLVEHRTSEAVMEIPLSTLPPGDFDEKTEAFSASASGVQTPLGAHQTGTPAGYSAGMASLDGRTPVGSPRPDEKLGSEFQSYHQARSQPAAETPSIDGECVPFWLDILNPTEEELRVICKAFGIHPLTSEDISLRETREKVELFPTYYFICFSSFDVDHKRKKTAARRRNNAGNNNNATGNNGSGNGNNSAARSTASSTSVTTRGERRDRKPRLKPLLVYTIVFKTGVISVHYAPTVHTINVRRRIRLLRDYVNVSSDWISYAIIDDITDGFAPMIAAIEEDVTAIEDAILNMHGTHSSDEESDDDDKSVSQTSGSSSTGYREWRQKGDMLRQIGESRKRVTAVLGLLGSKADVIKGFSKRVTERWSGASRGEIALYLSDIQDHLVTMVQSLTHYEKLLARCHSNYLAQLNIDMTRTNNDMNDVLGKLSVLGTIVLPMNVVTGLWGMNVMVPGQEVESLHWFFWLVMGMCTFGVSAYFVIKRYI